jgi:hypothetical protein
MIVGTSRLEDPKKSKLPTVQENAARLPLNLRAEASVELPVVHHGEVVVAGDMFSLRAFSVNALPVEGEERDYALPGNSQAG